ncbi:hypothetical protein MKZ38_006053 [Zalerion maritima]|uniref:LITAF domain-containing protein n=1 Tax=Zalerion maritima TaxID=339359 RepID=A0AAD5RKL2_9PEZI|nr:hypothetical protein MKZ38_006053 [Zalerion maritima]
MEASHEQLQQQGTSPVPAHQDNFHPGNDIPKQPPPPEYSPSQEQAPRQLAFPEDQQQQQQQQQPEPQPQQEYQQMAQQQQPGGYIMETPLPSLGEHPAVVRCTKCNQVGMTRVEYESGGSTHGWAALLCLCCCLGCIPYMMSSLKDVVHYCNHCNAALITWHRSGRTTVHAPPPQHTQPQPPADNNNKYQ